MKVLTAFNFIYMKLKLTMSFTANMLAKKIDSFCTLKY